LRKSVLVFFDDILVYKKAWQEHMRHLDEVLSVMEARLLYSKESKCEFIMKNILYLGHIISAQGVQVHQENIRAILDWPTPRNMTELRSFFGLCSYYMHFFQGFSQLGAPPTDINKHGDFICTEESQKSFDHIKEVIYTCPVLTLLDFTLPFVLECDAYGEDIRAIFM
jgi:hypothetical protein